MKKYLRTLAMTALAGIVLAVGLNVEPLAFFISKTKSNLPNIEKRPMRHD